MAYIYCADIYCDDCGKACKEDIERAGHAPADPDDEHTYDSDDYPKWADDDDETDSPQHCGNHEHCLNAIELPSGRKIGALIGTNLTTHGAEYLREMLAENDGCPEVHAFWRGEFSDYLDSDDEEDDMA